MQEKRFFITSILVGLLLRLVWMPFWLHVDPSFGGDLLAISRFASSFLLDNSVARTPYPPLALLTVGAYQFPWLSHLYRTLPSAPGWQQVFSSPDIFFFLFASKTLYLLFDLSAAFFLLRIFGNDPQQRRRAWLFWLFNPLIIYGAYVHGQFDIVAIFFVVVSLWFARNGKSRWAAFSLGIGSCFKVFPFFFLLPLVLISTRTWRERLVLLLFGSVPYALFFIPFLGGYGESIRNYPNWYFKGSYDLGFGAQVYAFLVFYAAMLWYLHHRKANTFEDWWHACFATLLVYYQFSYFDLHYWAWAVPFAAIYWVERPGKAKLFYLVILACLLVLAAPTPVARFLAPVSPRFFLRLPSLLELLNPYLPMLFIVNVVRSLLAGTCFYLAWRLLGGVPGSRGDAVLAGLETAATGGA
jgi:hypothetical protein